MVTLRKDPLETGEVYHICNKSIAGFVIFKDEIEYVRMLDVIRYYQQEKPEIRFSQFIRSPEYKKGNSEKSTVFAPENKIVDIIAFCLMPTHIHLVLKQLRKEGISIFMNNVQNSYARYFNLRHKRKGPLWEGRFKNVHVDDDDQLLHLSRYVHLNPVTAYLVKKPQQWMASSYGEYIGNSSARTLCHFQDVLKIKPEDYQKFSEDQISYQRELAEIRKFIFD